MSIVWNFLRLYSLLERINIVFLNLMNVLLLYRTINTGATGLVNEPQLELTAILRVKIDCHRSCYVISSQSHVFVCN